MKLESVRLQNYRGHRDLLVDFQPGFNVIVGLNGSGKTSLLKGLCEALTGLADYLVVPSGHQPVMQSTELKSQPL